MNLFLAAIEVIAGLKCRRSRRSIQQGYGEERPVVLREHSPMCARLCVMYKSRQETTHCHRHNMHVRHKYHSNEFFNIDRQKIGHHMLHTSHNLFRICLFSKAHDLYSQLFPYLLHAYDGYFFFQLC